MLWMKTLHIVFVVTWFAGLLYLPRLFVYHLGIGPDDSAGHARFLTMERRLLIITHIGGTLALAFGVALMAWWMRHSPDFSTQGWLHAKLTLVALLVAFHVYCALLARRFAARTTLPGSTWLKWFNEVPALLLIVIVALVVIKPF